MKERMCSASFGSRVGAPNGRSLSWLQCLLTLAGHNCRAFTSRMTLPGANFAHSALQHPPDMMRQSAGGHVSLQNVHIRYEDSVSTSGPLACGLVLQNLTAVTTNSKWKATQIDADARSLFKV
ncbi:vacuolar protein sorting-associated protein 13 [Trichonephila clavipes]|nr:vacuolar protein sorting-associated protein 13 [Trichonephila clavipes]